MHVCDVSKVGAVLQGLKVLETANVITGPFTGMLLADLGAEVLKVESLDGGDPFRKWEADSEATKPTFASYNHGKKSLALDLKSERGRDVYRRLVADSDVLIQNFRPGAMERLGLGWEDLRQVNPRLVYCHITGVGPDGPEAGRPIFDAVAQALSGLWSQFTDLDDPEPVGPPFADQLTAVFASYAILAGVHKAKSTGQGVKLEISMLAACLAFQTMGVATLAAEGAVPTKSSRARQSQSYAFITADGLPIAIHLSTPHKFWTGLCHAAGRPELVTDERFATKPLRVKHYDELHDVLAEVFATRPRHEWLATLQDHDVPAAPILTLAEAVDHPQVRATGMLLDGPGGSGRGLVGSPVVVDGSRPAADVHCPALGEDTADVLARLGLTEEERRGLIADRVVS
jgi:crotonobetainyl-CoA:carnitine CoA-transferase CaiB-like acyl-CoA transferase